MNEIWIKLENWPNRIINLSYVPLIVENASVCLCHQCNSFSFDWLFLKLADKVDMDEILNKFDNWPDQIINFRYCWKSLCLTLSSGLLIQFWSNLPETCRWTWMKSWTSTKYGHWIIYLRVTFPWLLQKRLIDFVISITHSVLIRTSWNLQLRWT